MISAVETVRQAARVSIGFDWGFWCVAVETAFSDLGVTVFYVGPLRVTCEHG